MDPVSLDGRTIIIFDGPIFSKETEVIAAGFGAYDGVAFHVHQADGSRFTFPEDYLDLTELPLTGEWKNRYPDFEWYLTALPSDKANKPNQPAQPTSLRSVADR